MKEHMTQTTDSRLVKRIGWIASIMAILMYVSYIDQIMRNLAGHSGSVILPIMTVINCSFWVLYGWLKPSKDWPIICCNLPGIVLGLITIVTALH